MSFASEVRKEAHAAEVRHAAEQLKKDQERERMVVRVSNDVRKYSDILRKDLESLKELGYEVDAVIMTADTWGIPINGWLVSRGDFFLKLDVMHAREYHTSGRSYDDGRHDNEWCEDYAFIYVMEGIREPGRKAPIYKESTRYKEYHIARDRIKSILANEETKRKN